MLWRSPEELSFDTLGFKTQMRTQAPSHYGDRTLAIAAMYRVCPLLCPKWREYSINVLHTPFVKDERQRLRKLDCKPTLNKDTKSKLSKSWENQLNGAKRTEARTAGTSGFLLLPLILVPVASVWFCFSVVIGDGFFCLFSQILQPSENHYDLSRCIANSSLVLCSTALLSCLVTVMAP